MQNCIKIYQKVQAIGPGSRFSEFEPRQNLDQSQMTLTISLATSCQYQCVCKFHYNIPLRSSGRAIFTFQNLELGKASTDEKRHFAISWARSCQYQCVCKSLSKYSSYRHFSLFVREQNLQKQSGDKSGDKIKCLIIGHTLKASLQLRLTFLESYNRWLRSHVLDLPSQ